MNYTKTILTVTGQVLGVLIFYACMMLIIALGTILFD